MWFDVFFIISLTLIFYLLLTFCFNNIINIQTYLVNVIPKTTYNTNIKNKAAKKNELCFSHSNGS